MCMAPLARGRMFGRSDLAKMAEDEPRKKGPWLVGLYVGDEILPSYIGIIS